MHQEFLNTCIKKTNTNIKKFNLEFPHFTENKKYNPMSNEEWTSSFWTGILWLIHLFTSKELYKQIAEKLLLSFYQRLDLSIKTETHDLGFLYILSCVPNYEYFQDLNSYKYALKAADKLKNRFIENPGFIQAFGAIPPEKELSGTIIDSLMNLPLLFWTSKRTGNVEYAKKAEKHATTIANFFLRKDGSTYQVCYFKPLNNYITTEKDTIQGYSNNSCWSRGQAWAIYGFTLCYKYTNNKLFLDSAINAADYFISRLPKDDKVCHWDLFFKEGKEPRDSSAAAIAVSGLYDLSLVITNTQKSAFYRSLADDILKNLCFYYSTKENDNNDGLLLHSTYHYPKGWGIDESCIWGDYFYLESLLKYAGFGHSLWYYT